jgi:hemoglobin
MEIPMYKTFAAVASALLAVSPALASPATRAPAAHRTNKPPQPAGQTLYDRLGGIFPIAAVVDRFSDQIVLNPKLNKNPALIEWNSKEAATRLPGLKFMRTLWLAALAGGPFKYSGMPLHDAHTRFSLTSDEFDEVGAEIVRALDYYKVPDHEKQELVTAYMRSKPEVVGSRR